MRLTTRARYGVRMMMHIARISGQGKPVSLGVVARLSGMSRGYLEQLATTLRHAGLLYGVAGKDGGYVLTRPADEIRLLDIVEAVIGRINIVECVGRPETCALADVCECRCVWEFVNDRIARAFEDISLAHLSDRQWFRRLRAQLESLEGRHALPPASAGRPRRS